MIKFIDKCRDIRLRREVLTGSAAVALAVLPFARARAGVEFVTSTANCSSHVAGSGASLTVAAGQNMQFEVWGNSVDLTDPSSGFTFTGPAGMAARIVTRRSGPTNFQRGCGNTGSAVVEVDTPPTLGANASASVSFKMPLGDLSRLNMTIVAHPVIAQATWTTQGTIQPTTLPCIVKTGSITAQNQDTKLVIQLPPGSAQDQTTCTTNVINVRLFPAGAQVDVAPSIQYRVTGLPSFLTVTQSPATTSVFSNPLLTFTFNVAGIRTLTAVSSATIKITNPIVTLRSTTLTLQVTPTPGQGFSQVATANPSTTNAGNSIDFTLKFSAPTRTGQVITWRMTQAACFQQAVTEAPYKSTESFQFFKLPPNQTTVNIRVTSVNNPGCTNKLALITHIFDAWIGDGNADPQVTTVTSGPLYTRTTVALRFPQ
jgi:hypothetical protein